LDQLKLCSFEELRGEYSIKREIGRGKFNLQFDLRKKNFTKI